MGELRILSSEGDTKMMWHPNNEDEVEVAEASFNKLINKGYAAFSVKKDGEQDEQIYEFNPGLGRIIMVPPLEGG